VVTKRKEGQMPAKTSSKPETVDQYLAGVPDEAREVLTAIRETIRKAAPEAEEGISYGIPLYRLGGKHLIGFGASKEHLSLYVMDSEVLRSYERELASFDLAGTRTTIRFTAADPLPRALVRKIVRARIKELEG
jgi:uncharacterized protein YdhG (YjbR/CyaY superfamily)